MDIKKQIIRFSLQNDKNNIEIAHVKDLVEKIKKFRKGQDKNTKSSNETSSKPEDGDFQS